MLPSASQGFDEYENRREPQIKRVLHTLVYDFDKFLDSPTPEIGIVVPNLRAMRLRRQP